MLLLHHNLYFLTIADSQSCSHIITEGPVAGLANSSYTITFSIDILKLKAAISMITILAHKYA